MRNEVGVAVALLVCGLKPSSVVSPAPDGQSRLARKRWIAQKHVESGVRAREDLGKLDLPVEWRDRTGVVAQGGGDGGQFSPSLKTRGSICLERRLHLPRA